MTAIWSPDDLDRACTRYVQTIDAWSTLSDCVLPILDGDDPPDDRGWSQARQDLMDEYGERRDA